MNQLILLFDANHLFQRPSFLIQNEDTYNWDYYLLPYFRNTII